MEVNPKHLNGFLAISQSSLEEDENINVRLKCIRLDEKDEVIVLPAIRKYSPYPIGNQSSAS